MANPEIETSIAIKRRLKTLEKTLGAGGFSIDGAEIILQTSVDAQNIIFIGFGFYRDNLNQLGLPDAKDEWIEFLKEMKGYKMA